MIRRLVAILIVAALALALGWAANQPGRVSIDWFGWTVAAHPAWLIALLLLIIGLPLLLAWSWIWLRYRSGLFGPARTLRRQAAARGYSAGALAAQLTRQPTRAGKLAARALRIDPNDWTAATVAALNGDQTQDVRLREDPATALLAALTAYRRAPSRDTAEAAVALAPASPFAWEAVLTERAKAGDFAAARQAVANWAALDPDLAAQAGRVGASLDYAAAEAALAASDRERAQRLLESALKADPRLAPAAAALADLQGQEDRTRAAERIIESAWSKQPHPKLAQAYAALQPIETQAARLERFQRLANSNPGHPESRLTLATHALAAGEAAQALETLGPLLTTEPVRTRAAQLAAQAYRRLGMDPPATAAWIDALEQGAPEPDWVCGHCHAHSREWRLECPSCSMIGRLVWDDGSAWSISSEMAAFRG